MTFVIVHGAGGRGSHWQLVAAHLGARGHDVVAPDLPADDDSAGLDAYTEAVLEAVGDRRELVVVGHSLGGFTAPLVCERLPVELLVLVTAMVPVPGETGGEWWANTGHSVSVDDADQVFLHDVPAEVLAGLEAPRDQSGRVMEDPWPLEAWPAVDTRFVLCTEDRFFPPQWMRSIVETRLGVVPDELGAGHVPYLSHPAELAALLHRYATSR